MPRGRTNNPRGINQYTKGGGKPRLNRNIYGVPFMNARARNDRGAIGFNVAVSRQARASRGVKPALLPVQKARVRRKLMQKGRR